MRPPPKQTFYHHNAVVSPQNGSKWWATSATSIKPQPANINQPLSDAPFSESLAGCKVMNKSPRIRCSRQKVHSLQGLQLLATCSDGLAFPAFQNYPIEAQQSSFHQSKQANKDTQWGFTRNNETSYFGST